MKHAIAVHVYPQDTAACRNRPRLPSLAAKACSSAGQAAFALRAMATLQAKTSFKKRSAHG